MESQGARHLCHHCHLCFTRCRWYSGLRCAEVVLQHAFGGFYSHLHNYFHRFVRLWSLWSAAPNHCVPRRCRVLGHPSHREDPAGLELEQLEGLEAVASVLVLPRRHVPLRVPSSIRLAVAQLGLYPMLGFNACDWQHCNNSDETLRRSIEQRGPWPLLCFFGLAIRELAFSYEYSCVMVANFTSCVGHIIPDVTSSESPVASSHWVRYLLHRHVGDLLQ